MFFPNKIFYIFFKKYLCNGHGILSDNLATVSRDQSFNTLNTAGFSAYFEHNKFCWLSNV